MTIIHEEDLKKLSSLRKNESPVISLYLNLTPPRNFKTELQSLIHQRKMELKENDIDKSQLGQIEDLLKRIQQQVKQFRGRENTRLWACFASVDGFWQEYHLPVSLPSRMHIDPDPYVRPISVLLDEFERHCLLVVDSKKARLFTLYFGEIEEHLGLLESEVPGRVSEDYESKGAKGIEAVGGSITWSGWRESKIQRHIQDHIHRHLKEVSQRVYNAFKRFSFDRLIVGGPKGGEGEIVPWLVKGHLHSYLKERYIGAFAGNPDMSESKLLKRANEVAASYEIKEEEKIISKLLNESKRSDGYGVLGIQKVLSAIPRGQVRTLVVDHDFSISGWVCPNDHCLSTEEQLCPQCQGEMAEVRDFIDEVIEEVINQKGEIEHIFTDHQEFSKYQIGALLRFRV